MEPRELKDALVNDWIEGERKHGVSQDPAKIERTVVRDLDRWERERKNARPRAEKLAKEQKVIKKRINESTTVFQRPVPQEPDHVPFSKMPCGVCGQCKLCKMSMRLATVVQLDEHGQPLYPALHKQFTYEHWMSKIGAGPYYKLSAVDIARRLLRRCEDICDQSNGIPGFDNWWVQ